MVTATGTVNENGASGWLWERWSLSIHGISGFAPAVTSTSSMVNEGAPIRPTHSAKKARQSPPAVVSTAVAMSSKDARLNRLVS